MHHPPLRIGAWQFAPKRGDVAGNLARAERGLAAAADGNLHLVVLPEMWTTSFLEGAGALGSEADVDRAFSANDRALEHLCALSATYRMVVAGSAYGPPGVSGRRTNRLFVFDRGRVLLTQDKLHLFSPTAEHFGFAPGEPEVSVAEVTFGRLGGAVCYDLRFPRVADALLGQAPDVVVVPAQWPTARAKHWRALLQGRAVELQAFLVGANRTGSETVGRRGLELHFPGNSLVASPDGSLLAEGRGEDGLVWAEVDLGLLARLRRDVPVSRDRRMDVGWTDPGRPAPGAPERG